MAEIKLTQISKLTLDNVSMITIHSTYGSLRRAMGTKTVVTVPAVTKDASGNSIIPAVPTLYYVKEVDPDTKVSTWATHALSADINEFLLFKSTDDDSSAA